MPRNAVPKIFPYEFFFFFFFFLPALEKKRRFKGVQTTEYNWQRAGWGGNCLGSEVAGAAASTADLHFGSFGSGPSLERCHDPQPAPRIWAAFAR